MASPDLARAFILAKSLWKSRDVVRMSDTLTDIHPSVKARKVEPHPCPASIVPANPPPILSIHARTDVSATVPA